MYTTDRGCAAEARRIARLRALLVLDSEAEPIFDTLAQLASEACETPIALVSLVDAGRQWFKANIGLPGASETPRDVAFCDHAIRGDEVMEVPDALLDSRFARNPLVTGAPDIRFYAGAPLKMSSGERIGTLCVIDRQARHLSASQTHTLRNLARLTVQALEMRERSVRQSLEVRSAHERALADSEQRLRAILDAQSELVSQATPDGRLLYVNPAYAAFVGREVDALIGANLYDFVPAAERATVRQHIQQVLDGGPPLTTENRNVSPDGTDHWVSWTNTLQLGPDGTPLVHSTGRDVTARRQAERALARSQALLERTGRIARVGGWEVDLRSGQVSWTDETRRIHEVGPDFQPTMESALAFYSATSRPVIEAAVQRAIADGSPWDLELELLTATGRTIWARAVGEVELDQGRPVRLFGAFQDITARREAAAAHLELSAIIEHTSDFVILADRERRVRYMNPAAEKALLGRPRVAGPLPFVRELLPPATQRKFAEQILPQLHEEGIWLGESSAYLADGREVPVSHMVIALRDPMGEIDRFAVILRNIAQQVADHEERERQTRTLRSVADAIPSTVAVMDAQGRYVFVNRAFEQHCGRAAADILGRGAREVLGEAEFERRQPWVRRVLDGEAVRFELANSGGAGPRHTALDYLPLRRSDGSPDGFVVVGQDVTATRQEQARLELLSMTDPLTRLLNRAGFERRLEGQLGADFPEPLALLYIDLDRFKPVNDSHGHGAGDELLRSVARRLIRLVRPTDIVARLGGDEFAVAVLGMADLAQARRLAQSIVEAIGLPFQLSGGLVVQIGASVGGALGDGLRANWPAMLAAADAQLYAAKAAGRGRWAVVQADDSTPA